MLHDKEDLFSVGGRLFQAQYRLIATTLVEVLFGVSVL